MKVSIDPGKHGIAAAAFQGERLVWAGWIPDSADETAWAFADRASRAIASKVGLSRESFSVTIERPQHYQLAHQRGDQRDLSDLTLLVGCLASSFHQYLKAAVDLRFPAEWKGNVPKEISRLRVEEALEEFERDRIEWPAFRLRHNVYDAIHLGLRAFTSRKA